MSSMLLPSPYSTSVLNIDFGATHTLQAAYKQELHESYGIAFDNLLCLNNMPIKRYVDYLQRRGQLEDYMQVLFPASCTFCGVHAPLSASMQMPW